MNRIIILTIACTLSLMQTIAQRSRPGGRTSGSGSMEAGQRSADATREMFLTKYHYRDIVNRINNAISEKV